MTTQEATEEVLTCAFQDGKKATQTVVVTGGTVIMVCTPCERALHANDKKKRCQYCGIPILDDWKKTALPGCRHSVGCPRRYHVDIV